jgi:predicted DCC family thiol-disulfide oxidoreductase YuxK
MPLLYDEDCGFCKVSVAVVLAWDRRRRLRPIAIQSPEGQRLLAAIPEARRLESAHVMEPGGGVRSGGAAARPVLDVLPGGRPLARLAARAPGLADRAYRAVAGRRSTLGKLLPRRARRWADTRLN